MAWAWHFPPEGSGQAPPPPASGRCSGQHRPGLADEGAGGRHTHAHSSEPAGVDQHSPRLAPHCHPLTKEHLKAAAPI